MNKDKLKEVMDEIEPEPPKKVEAYECNNCRSLFHDERDAEQCCRPSPVAAYECYNCQSLWLYEDEARRCCQ